MSSEGGVDEAEREKRVGAVIVKGGKWSRNGDDVFDDFQR